MLLALAVLAAAAPARADSLSDARHKRDAARAKKTEIASKIDVLKASDRDLEKAENDLDGRARAQENDVIAAQQAVQAAQETVRQAEKDLAATDRRMHDLRSALASRAISIYMNPVRASLLDLMGSHTFAEASRREALLTHVISSDRDVIDQLRSVREDQDGARVALSRARDLARQRRQAAVEGLRALQQARSEKDRVHTALQGRIADFLAEADAVDREEANLTALIRSRDAAVGPVSASGLIWPVNGPVTSGFGMRWGRMHQGIDISAPTGTPIHAAKAGTVIFAAWMGGYGNAVIISHGGGFSTLYGHQSRLGSSEGQSVTQGQTIGFVGSTGHSTGPHVHFETRVNGTPQNPRNFLR